MDPVPDLVHNLLIIILIMIIVEMSGIEPANSWIAVGQTAYLQFGRSQCGLILSIHIIKQSPPPRLSVCLSVCLSARDKLEKYCTDFHAVFTSR